MPPLLFARRPMGWRHAKLPQGAHALEGAAEVELRFLRDVAVRTLGAGAVFGETALLTGAPRSATVRALDDVVLFEIDRTAFEPVLAARPQLVTDLGLLMASRQQAGAGAVPESLAARIRTFFFGARAM